LNDYYALCCEHVEEARRRFARCLMGRAYEPSFAQGKRAHELAVVWLALLAAEHPAWDERAKRQIEGLAADWILDQLQIKGIRRLPMKVFVGAVLDVLLEWVIRRARAQELPGGSERMFGGSVNDALVRFAAEIRAGAAVNA